MKTFRLTVEKLEGRRMLDAAGAIQCPAVQDSALLFDVAAVVAPADLNGVQTPVQLVGGQTMLLGVSSEDLCGDLAGVEFVLLQSAGPSTPEIAGVILLGAYTPDGVLNMEGTGILQTNFIASNPSPSTTLKAGGSLIVKVEQNNFKEAQISGVEVEVDIAGSGQSGPLKLNGMLNEGTYKPGEGVTFDARLEVTEDFVYEKAPVKTTLKSGGFLQVSVVNSDFDQATIDQVEGLVEIEIDGQGPLKLGGSLSGKYENGLLDLDCTLSVRETFEYTRESFTARMSSGQVGVQVAQSDLIFAVLDVESEVDVDIPNTNGLKLGGTLSGRYEDGKIDIDGNLSLRSDWSISGPRIVTSILSGQTLASRIDGSAISVDLRAAEFLARVDLGPATAEFRGVIEYGAVENQRYVFRGSGSLKSPVVLFNLGRRRLVLADAKLDLILSNNGARRIWLHDLRLRWVVGDDPLN